MTLIFKQAPADQIQEVLDLFREISAQLKKKGLTQWSYWANPPEEKMEWVGIFRLLEADALYWDEKGLEEGVRYIHSLVTVPGRSGEGIGAQVLQELAVGLKKQGMHKLRLDCDSSNSRLCSYYEQQGFFRVGTKQTLFSINNLYERTL